MMNAQEQRDQEEGTNVSKDWITEATYVKQADKMIMCQRFTKKGEPDKRRYHVVYDFKKSKVLIYVPHKKTYLQLA